MSTEKRSLQDRIEGYGDISELQTIINEADEIFDLNCTEGISGLREALQVWEDALKARENGEINFAIEYPTLVPNWQKTD